MLIILFFKKSFCGRGDELIYWIIIIVFNIPILYHAKWIVNAWFNSPIDRYGPLWFILAFIVLSLNIKFLKNLKFNIDFTGIFLSFFSFFLLALGIIFKINILSASSALIFSISCIWLICGWEAFLIFSPIYGIILLSMPTTSYIANYICMQAGFTFSVNPEIIKLSIFTLLIIFSYFYPRQKKYYLTKLNGLYWISVCVFCLFSYLSYSPKAEISPPFNLDIDITPWNGWYGNKSTLTKIEEKLFYGESIEKYYFYNESGYVITLLKFNSNQSPHNIHPPDYCLKGGGWTINSDSYFYFDLKDSKYCVRKIYASLNNRKEMIFSWFTSKNKSTADYKIFRLNQGKFLKTNWEAYLISINIRNSDYNKSEKLLLDFINRNFR